MSENLAAQHPSPENREQPEKEKKRRGVAWWWLLVALAMAGLVAGPIWYASLYAKKPEPAPQAEAPAKTHADKQKVENAFFFRIDGKDKQGRPATFDFIILANEYTWVKGSTAEVVSGGAVIPEAEVADRVLTPQVRDFARERKRPDFGWSCLAGGRAHPGGSARGIAFTDGRRLDRQGQQTRGRALDLDAGAI